MLKAIYAQETRADALEKARKVAEKLEALKLFKASSFSEWTEETMMCYKFLPEHWRCIRTNNPHGAD